MKGCNRVSGSNGFHSFLALPKTPFVMQVLEQSKRLLLRLFDRPELNLDRQTFRFQIEKHSAPNSHRTSEQGLLVSLVEPQRLPPRAAPADRIGTVTLHASSESSGQPTKGSQSREI